MERRKNKRNKEDGETKENMGDGDFEQGDEERETDKKKKKRAQRTERCYSRHPARFQL